MLTFDYKHPQGAEFALDMLSHCLLSARGLGDRGIKSWVKLGLIGPPEVNWMFGGLITTGLHKRTLRWVHLGVGGEHHCLVVLSSWGGLGCDA